MNAVSFGLYVSRTARRMTDFLHTTTVGRVTSPAPLGLPAGAVYLPYEKVIFAATACGKGVFNDAMWIAAAQTGADILVAHQGRYPVPEVIDDVTFTMLVHIGGEPHLIEDMVLYWQPDDGYWLLPSAPGPFIALEDGGPRVSFRAPFLDIHDRAAGVAAAAARIIRATRREMV